VKSAIKPCMCLRMTRKQLSDLLIEIYEFPELNPSCSSISSVENDMLYGSIDTT